MAKKNEMSESSKRRGALGAVRARSFLRCCSIGTLLTLTSGYWVVTKRFLAGHKNAGAAY